MAGKRCIAVAIDLGFALPHHADVYSGIQRFAIERDHWDCVLEPYMIPAARPRGRVRYDGVIGRITPRLAAQIRAARIPAVNVWAGSTVTTIPRVVPDFAAIGRMAAEHLLERGYRHFACQGIRRHRGHKLAMDAFANAVKAAGWPCPYQQLPWSAEVEKPSAWHHYVTELERWIAEWQLPVGVFATQDIYCRYLANVCRHMGLRIPEDVGLLGTGNTSILCVRPEPSLSSIDLGYERLGYEAAALLDRRLDGRKIPAETHLPPTGLTVRRSTSVVSSEDQLVVEAARFVREHAAQGITADDVATALNVSRRVLGIRFERALSRTPHDEILRVRFRLVEDLLENTDLKLAAIAPRCGFRGAEYMCTAFQKRYGMSPSQWRRMRRG